MACIGDALGFGLDLTCQRLGETCDCAQKGCLARAVRPAQHQCLARVEREIHLGQNLNRAARA